MPQIDGGCEGKIRKPGSRQNGPLPPPENGLLLLVSGVNLILNIRM